jgi:hypothetical protein
MITGRAGEDRDGTQPDVREFSENRMSQERAAELESQAAEVSGRLPGEHRGKITRFDATTGGPASVASEAAPSVGQDFVRRALQHVTAISPALGLPACQAPEFVPDPMVQEAMSGAKTVHLQDATWRS